MIDVAALRGSTVRDNAGTRGEILSVSLPWVRVGWWDEGAAVPREESFIRSDPPVASIEKLTKTERWVAAGRFLGTIKEDDADEDDDEEVVLVSEDLEDLLLEKPRSPFKTAAKLGRSVRSGRWRHKKDYWDCSGSNYNYVCKGKEGETKKIKVKSGWKKAYNQDYKEYNKASMKKAASFTKITLKNRRKRAQAKKKKKK